MPCERRARRAPPEVFNGDDPGIGPNKSLYFKRLAKSIGIAVNTGVQTVRQTLTGSPEVFVASGSTLGETKHTRQSVDVRQAN